MVVTFFGHRDVTRDIEKALEKTIIDVIKKYDADMFYVGNQGGFDRLVQNTLEKLSDRYNIDYKIVLAYMPTHKTDFAEKTIMFDEFEKSHPKYAILKCNLWMIDKSDIVITYVTHNIGGAAKFKNVADKKGKIVINIKKDPFD